jgi:hypothetical protein
MSDKDSSDIDYDALDEAESQNLEEVALTLELIKSSNVEPNIFNSMEWVNNLFERTQEPTTELLSKKLATLLNVRRKTDIKDYDTGLNYIGLEQIATLEQQFKLIRTRDEDYLPYEHSFFLESPLEVFLYDISYGQYPPPEILMMLEKCFRLYFEANGDLSLEEIFFGKAIKKAGNYSKRKMRSSNFKEFHYQVTHAKAHTKIQNNKFNLEEFTLSYLEKCAFEETMFPVENVSEENLESFIVSYYRWKKNNLTKKKSNLKFQEEVIDIISCLISLGYTEEQAQKATALIASAHLDIEGNLKKILLYLQK